MKALLVLGAVLAAVVPGWAKDGDSAKELRSEMQTEQGSYSVSVRPAEKRIEVKKIGGSEGTPPHLRVRFQRPNDRPLELRLHTIERPESPLLYTGQLKHWNGSYVGLELDISFDKKTWKRLGKTLLKAVP